MVYLSLVGGSLLVALEQTVDGVAPDFADGHAFVVRRYVEVFGGVVVFGNLRDVIAQRERYAVGEGLAGQVELVVPADGQLVTFRAQVGGILLRRRSTVGSRQSFARDKHVFGIADIHIAREAQSVVEEAQVDTDVFVDDSFPGEIARCGRRNRCVGEELAVGQIVVHLYQIQGLDVGIGARYGLVAERTVRTADLEVGEGVADRCKEGFFAHAPSGRNRGE